mmetsp:Transcript_20156/g.23328  ORF Transcript_20156/g.23328 Transcript_20156/m.23328 type:complete len:143 (-) Transcript_20156:50-478(-)
MCKIIAGLAKVWVSEIIEEAKLLQLQDEYKIRTHLGLNSLSENAAQKDISADSENSDNDGQSVPVAAGPAHELTKVETGDANDIAENDEQPNKNNEGEQLASQEEILKQTLFFESPLTPYYLKQARDEYERKRRKFNMKIFD